MAPLITVIGIGADGWAGLPESSRSRVLAAEVVLGGDRHLALLPASAQERRPWPSPLRPALPGLLDEYAGRTVVVLASGDPLVSGIGSTLLELGVEAEIVPAVSSVALARARMGWPAETVEWISLVGRDVRTLTARLGPGRRLLVLSGDETTPAAVASLLVAHGHASARVTVLGDLGGAAESRRDATAASLSSDPQPRLNVIALELGRGDLTAGPFGLPDETFETDGQITRRDVRISALARLAPQPGELLWDVGAGSGSVGIEWMRSHPRCRAIAIEARDDRASRASANAAALGVPGLQVVVGRAPAALAELPTPDAVFVGGGATTPGLIDLLRDALGPHGRLVAHAVTLETEALLVAQHAQHGGELTRLHTEQAVPLGGFTAWEPTRAITQWAWTKGAS